MFRSAVVGVFLLFALPGCSLLMPNIFPSSEEFMELTPRQEYAAANAVYETLVVALTRLGADGVLGVSHLEMIQPVLVRADEALDLWEGSLKQAQENREVGLVNRAEFFEQQAVSFQGDVERDLEVLKDIVQTADRPLIGG